MSRLRCSDPIVLLGVALATLIAVGCNSNDPESQKPPADIPLSARVERVLNDPQALPRPVALPVAATPAAAPLAVEPTPAAPEPPVAAAPAAEAPAAPATQPPQAVDAPILPVPIVPRAVQSAVAVDTQHPVKLSAKAKRIAARKAKAEKAKAAKAAKAAKNKAAKAAKAAKLKAAKAAKAAKIKAAKAAKAEKLAAAKSAQASPVSGTKLSKAKAKAKAKADAKAAKAKATKATKATKTVQATSKKSTPPAQSEPAVEAPAGADATDLYYSGKRKLDAGDYKGAIADLKVSQQLRPSARTLTLLGRAYFDGNKLPEAEKVLKQAGAHDEAQLLLANLYQQRGKIADARRVYQAFLQAHPDHAKAGWVRNLLQTL